MDATQDTKYEFGVDEKGVIHVIDEAGVQCDVSRSKPTSGTVLG